MGCDVIKKNVINVFFCIASRKSFVASVVKVASVFIQLFERVIFCALLVWEARAGIRCE